MYWTDRLRRNEVLYRRKRRGISYIYDEILKVNWIVRILRRIRTRCRKKDIRKDKSDGKTRKKAQAATLRKRDDVRN